MPHSNLDILSNNDWYEWGHFRYDPHAWISVDKTLDYEYYKRYTKSTIMSADQWRRGLKSRLKRAQENRALGLMYFQDKGIEQHLEQAIKYYDMLQRKYEQMLHIKLEKEEELLKIQLEKQKIQNEIKRKEIIIQPEIIPAVVATSALIPLGIIGLLLYTSKGKL
mgnify:CR=1 FL=1